MTKLKEESQDAYMKQFSQWDKCLKDNGVDSVEKLMEKVFDAVRKYKYTPSDKKESYKPKFEDESKSVIKTKKGSYRRDVKLTLE